jgi:hypothetical protein
MARLTTFLLLAMLAGTSLAANAPPANRLWLTYGDYMTGFQNVPDMVQILLATGEPTAPPIARLGLGIGAHGGTYEIWKSGAASWITGEGKAATTNWRDNGGGQKAAVPFEGRKADLAMVQLDLSYVAGRDAAKGRTEADEAVAGYVAAAKAAGARLVFYVLPGGQSITHKVAGRGAGAGNLVSKAAEEYGKELVLLDAECARLTEKHGAVMAPTFRAFAALRKAHPEMDLHAPKPGNDGHLSPKDAALCALVIGRAFLGEAYAPPATAETLIAPQNRQIAAENAKLKAKGQPELPLNTIDEATWAAMLEAVTAKGE